MLKNLNISVLLDYYGEMLSEKQRLLAESYYNADLSLAEVSENVGITRQGVRDNLKRCEAQLIEMEQKLHFVEQLSQVDKALKEICDECAVAKKALPNMADSAVLQQNIDKINNIALKVINYKNV